MENEPLEDYNSSEQKDEEFPIEEFESGPDWNTRAWEEIQARDAKALRGQSLAAYLSELPLSSLDAMFSVLNHDKQDLELRDAIVVEIERRVDGADTNAAMGSNLT